jgi:hypothetical protein
MEVSRGYDGFSFHPKGTAHAQVHDQHATIIQIDEQIFGAPPQRFYRTAFQPLSESVRKRKPQPIPPAHNLQYLPAAHGGLQTATDRFDFGQFGHD